MTAITRLTSLTTTALLAAAIGVGTVTATAPAQAQVPTPAATEGVTVTGLGTVNAVPDVLQINLRVVVVRPDVDSALRDANAVTARIRATLRARGVAAADLESTELQVTPSQGGKPPRIVGYQVVQGLSAQLRNVNTAGAVVTATIKAGGPFIRFDGIFFRLSDNAPGKVRARDRAFADARTKAEQLARLSGRALGPVRSVEEDVSPNYGFREEFTQFGGRAFAGPVPFSPGTQRVSVRIVARWSLQ